MAASILFAIVIYWHYHASLPKKTKCDLIRMIAIMWLVNIIIKLGSDWPVGLVNRPSNRSELHEGSDLFKNQCEPVWLGRFSEELVTRWAVGLKKRKKKKQLLISPTIMSHRLSHEERRGVIRRSLPLVLNRRDLPLMINLSTALCVATRTQGRCCATLPLPRSSTIATSIVWVLRKSWVFESEREREREVERGNKRVGGVAQ